ncbi:MAG: hypothetical protein CMN85_04365 [Spongiibacteraceae bacterium]|nr:hypothetical protein [Spongiibacteraceae bacterium]
MPPVRRRWARTILDTMMTTSPLARWLPKPQAADIKTVFRRVEQLGKLRLERARSLLSPRQQLFLDFLPLLFHCNHPSLPGFNSIHSPCGISRYAPNDELLQRVRRHLSSSFQQIGNISEEAIEALFLMGSVGSIAHARSSDIDVWVCHHPGLSSAKRQLLREKAESISRYADVALGLDVHFFLMCADEFRAGERKALSGEDCGSTQHFLLLDEFYRSAIALAGKHPLWWFIPPDTPDYEEAKLQLLRRHKRLRETTLDFGNVHRIPPGEYVGAGIWQLFKAISSPHKSLIKLLLIEMYARRHPDSLPISQQIKRTLHQPAGEPAAQDPYLLIYQRLESYLTERGESTRLELLRRALYFKTEVKLSLLPEAANWREQALRNMTGHWGWTHDHLRNLDMRDLWKVRRAREEHRSLVRELTGSYRFLQEFARSNAADQLISSHEMTVLGRKLFSAFERQPDKVEWINHEIAGELAEKHLSFCYLGKSDPTQSSWALIAGTAGLNHWHRKTPLRDGNSLPTLLCWCLCNGLVNNDTQLHLVSDHPHHHRGKLKSLTQTLRQYLPSGSYASQAGEHARFESPQQTETLICIVGNPTRDAPSIRHIDLITINSWGEVMCNALIGDHAVGDAINQILKKLPRSGQLPEIVVKAFSGDASEPAALQFERLVNETIAYFRRPESKSGDRYIFDSGNHYYLLQSMASRIVMVHATNAAELLSLLAARQSLAGSIEIASACASLFVLRCVVRHQQKGKLQIFFHQREEAADVFILDGSGALHYQTLLCDDGNIMLGHLRSFVNTLKRNHFRELPVQWLQLEQQGSEWVSQPLSTTAAADTLRIVVRMLAHRSADDSHRFDISINQKTLHFAQHGKDILKQAADYICEELPLHRTRFCYVNQIYYRDKQGQQPHVTTRIGEAMHHKAQIEEALNSAILAHLD